jgi:hypothetical protein
MALGSDKMLLNDNIKMDIREIGFKVRKWM